MIFRKMKSTLQFSVFFDWRRWTFNLNCGVYLGYIWGPFINWETGQRCQVIIPRSMQMNPDGTRAPSMGFLTLINWREQAPLPAWFSALLRRWIFIQNFNIVTLSQGRPCSLPAVKGDSAWHLWALSTFHQLQPADLLATSGQPGLGVRVSPWKSDRQGFPALLIT